jgi:HlyD family secretion protein
VRIVWIILSVLVVLCIVGAGAAFMGGKMKFNTGSNAGGFGTSVRAEPAKRGALAEVVSAPGVVQPLTKVDISGRVSARITELPFREGATVKKDDVVVKLDSTDAEANLRAAKARQLAQEAEIETANARINARQKDIEQLQVQMSERRRDLERQQALLASSDVAQSVVDAVKSEVDQLEVRIAGLQASVSADKTAIRVLNANLEAAKADIDRVEDSLSYYTIRSPMDGVITKLNKEIGELTIVGTTNTPGTTIMTIADLSKMIVETKVDETAVALVKPGQRADVRLQAYRRRTFTGNVETVALAQTQDTDNSKYYQTDVLLKTAGELVLSGLTADVDIEVARYEDVLLVPSQAIVGRPVDELPEFARTAPEVDQRKALASVVYRIVNGKAVVTPVRVGPSDMSHTLIESGLKADDLVIVGPRRVLDDIKNDDPVKLETPATHPATAPTSTKPS